MESGLEKVLEEESEKKTKKERIIKAIDKAFTGGWLMGSGADAAFSYLSGLFPFGTACSQTNLLYGLSGLSGYEKAKQASAVSQGMLGVAYFALYPKSFLLGGWHYHMLMIISSIFTLLAHKPSKESIMAGIGMGLAYYAIVGSVLLSTGSTYIW